MKKFLHAFKGTFVLLVGSVLFSQSSIAQFSAGTFIEAGVTVGPSNFLGDLGGTYGRGTTFLKDNNFPMTKLMVGAHLSVYPVSWLGFRLAVNTGKLEGDDAIIKGKGGMEEARKIRNENFRTKLFETFLVGELYPTVLLEQDPDDVFHKLRPYGIFGVGLFHFNPQGYDFATKQWVYLKPLHTEGQGFAEYPDRKNYSLWQLNIPMGAGIKFWLTDNVSLGLEVIHRKTFTDYIDDVSTTYIDPQLFYKYLPANQAALAERMANKTNNGTGSTTYGPGDKRGDPKQNDAYYSFGFKLGIRLGSGGDRSWNNSTRCPVLRY